MTLTCYIQVERNSVEAVEMVSTFQSSVPSLYSLSLVSCHLPEKPPEFACPVDHIQMTDIFQGSLIHAPFGAVHTDQTVVIALDTLDDPM